MRILTFQGMPVSHGERRTRGQGAFQNTKPADTERHIQPAGWSGDGLRGHRELRQIQRLSRREDKGSLPVIPSCNSRSAEAIPSSPESCGRDQFHSSSPGNPMRPYLTPSWPGQCMHSATQTLSVSSDPLGRDTTHQDGIQVGVTIQRSRKRAWMVDLPIPDELGLYSGSNPVRVGDGDVNVV